MIRYKLTRAALVIAATGLIATAGISPAAAQEEVPVNWGPPSLSADPIGYFKEVILGYVLLSAFGSTALGSNDLVW